MAELLIRVNVDGAQKIDDLKGKLAGVDEANDKATKGTSAFSASLNRLGGVIAAVGVATLVTETIKLADTYSLMQGRLSLVTNSANQLAEVNNALFKIAQESRVGLESTVDLYARLARSTESLGVSQGDLLSVTETINKSFIISGASAQAADAAIVQLGQAFASGTLRGDELNSVLEQAPRLAQAIADGLGVTVGKLRQLGADGKLTSEQIFNAIKKSGTAIEDEFGKMPKTVGQSMTQVNNALLTFIGEADKATGASSTFGSAISGLGGILESATVSLHNFNIEIKRLQDVRKIKTFEDANTALKQINEEIKALTTSTDLTDRASRALKGQVQIQYELNQLYAARESLNRKVVTMAQQEEKATNTATKAKITQVEKTKEQLREEKKLANERERELKRELERQKQEFEDFAKEQDDDYSRYRKAKLDKRIKEIDDAYDKAVKDQDESDAKALKSLEERYNAEMALNDALMASSATTSEMQIYNIHKNAQAWAEAGADIEQVLAYIESETAKTGDLIGRDLMTGMDVARNAVKGLEDALVDAFMNGRFEADKMFKAILADLARLAIQQSIIAPLFGGFFPSANGNAFVGGQPVTAFANGGAFTNSVVNSPTVAPMALFGEAGPEAIMPLTRIGGELGVKAVMPNQQNMKVEIINQSGTQVEATQSTAKFDGEQFVLSVVIDAARRNKSGFRDILQGGR